MDGKTERIEAGQWYHVPAGKIHAAAFPEATVEIEFWFDSQPD
jgi:quercetin dioxygenase-like cupin family protein